MKYLVYFPYQHLTGNLVSWCECVFAPIIRLSCTIFLILLFRIMPCHIARFCRVISHSLGDIQHAHLNESLSVSNHAKQCYCESYCFTYLICAYLCQMSWLACRVIIPVPCHHLFTRFPMEGHKILCKHIGVTTSWQPYWCSKMMKWWPYWCTKPILWEFNSFLNICKHYLLFQ